MLGTRYLHTATGGVRGAEVLVCGGTGEDARTCEVLTPGGWQMLGLALQWRSGHVAWRHSSSNNTYLLGGEGKQNNADVIDSDHSLMIGIIFKKSFSVKLALWTLGMGINLSSRVERT